jgi:hypothetical protein
MKLSREEVLDYFLETLRSMGDEWEDEVEVTEDTLIMGNLNWRSIEIVYLANALQQRFEQVFPFEEFLQQIEQREVKDITVREWVDFVYSHLEDRSEREPVSVGSPAPNAGNQDR